MIGTHVTGTIAALNNTFGVVGVVEGPELHIVRVFAGIDYSVDPPKSVGCRSSELAKAVEKCIDAGANVINMVSRSLICMLDEKKGLIFETF